MSPAQILRGTDFTQVAEVYADAKRRVTLTRIKRAEKVYRVYENAIGQIILDPLVMVPASEMWLHENKAAIASVRKGLQESAEGKAVAMPSLAKHANDDIDD